MACVIDDQRSDSAQPRPQTPDENSRTEDSLSVGSASVLTPKRVSWWRRAWGILPQVGAAGSRSAHLHVAEDEFGDDLSRYDNVSVLVKAASGVDLLTPSRDGSVIPFGTLTESKSKHLTRPGSRHSFVFPTLGYQELRRFAFLRWLGTLGALLLGFGALGAGAMPVVNSPYAEFPGGSLMWRMLQTSTMLCFVGVSLIVVAWLLMAPFTGVALRRGHVRTGVISMSMMRRTFLVWSLPIVASAPMFTQDIYSYLANGSIVRLGLDPYSGGPIDLLGTENVLARSVPFIWAHSPSPYGPVALGVATIISWLTNDSIVLGVIAHRMTAIVGVALAGWAVVQLARRCRVIPQAALWLGILNPLTILHLVGGIHNESILLGLLLAGVELGLRAADFVRLGLFHRAWWLLTASGFLISCAGMVKVTGFIGLGFIGMAVARSIRLREHSVFLSWLLAIFAQTVMLCVSVALVTWMSGIPLGWISGQGGAATIRSWMSMSTAIGVVFSWLAEQLALGNHSDAMLVVTRVVGIAIAGVFMVRMLLATYAGRIHPVGALGVSTFVMVIFFPVVHPWYMLWAILPLSAWANRELFRGAVIAYTLVLSFFVLPRGLGLPPTTVLSIYIASIVGFGVIIASSYVILKRRGVIDLH